LTLFQTDPEFLMLSCAKVIAATEDAHPVKVHTTDTGAICLGGGFRLPAATATADPGKIRLGGGFRLAVPNA
jgi:hypothetical protein